MEEKAGKTDNEGKNKEVGNVKYSEVERRKRRWRRKKRKQT